ncbi:MAG TPA: hypothetical protein VN836_07575 [Verrucomicrobiae bacterium]|nr:hypothetical protein [Verrucomicrobiae bacterium]
MPANNATKLFLLIVASQVVSAILLTYLFNATNTGGLDPIGPYICLALALICGFLYRRRLPIFQMILVIPAALFVSFIAYILIGYYGLGWTGLMKE